MAKLRFAFIGCGSHASACLQPCISMIEEFDFIATCDLEVRKAESNARRFGALRSYADWREMLDKEELDAVGVCGTPQMHTELAIGCLDAGVHVFLEKPHAVSLSESQRVLDAASRSGKMGMVATMWRHARAHQMQKALMERDDFGRPMLFDARYMTPGPRSPLWGQDSVLWSYLLAQSVHPIDCMRFLMGDVAEVRTNLAEFAEGALSIDAHFRYTSGAVGSMCMTSAAAVIDIQVLVGGDAGGMAEVTNMTHLRYGQAPPWIGEGGYMNYPMLTWDQGSYYLGIARPGYVEELTHFARAILAGEQPHASLEDAHKGLVICQAILDSARDATPVAL